MAGYVLLPAAEDDLNEICLYIAADKPGAALDMADRLQDACRRLAEFPDLGRTRPELGSGLRGFPVSNYVIFYRFKRRRVEVIRILHGRRDIRSHFE